MANLTEYLLDAMGLFCPMPVIKLQDKVKDAVAGDIIILKCSDPGVLQDIPAWCRINGHEVLETREVGSEIVIKVKVNK